MRRMLRWLAVAAVLSGPAGMAMAREPQAATAAAAFKTIQLSASADRKVDVSVWEAAQPKGIVIFGHGLGGEPASYASLLTRWQQAGYTILAPLNVDSRNYADRAKFDRMSGFMARVTDLMVTRNAVAAMYPGKPVILAGHSYGTLFSLYGAGAAAPTGPLPFPPAAGVIALSSPGAIPMLVTKDTFASVAVPLLTITGDADTVPGFVPDWKAHRLPFDTSKPGRKTLVVFQGGGHDLALRGTPQQQRAVMDLTTDFLDAVASGDTKAQARLDAVQSTDLFSIERR